MHVEKKMLVVIISDNILVLDVLMRALCGQVNMPARLSRILFLLEST